MDRVVASVRWSSPRTRDDTRVGRTQRDASLWAAAFVELYDRQAGQVLVLPAQNKTSSLKTCVGVSAWFPIHTLSVRSSNKTDASDSSLAAFRQHFEKPWQVLELA
jgi:hypothetical protein